MIWIFPHPLTPSTPSQSSYVSPVELTEGGGGGGGAGSYDGEKAWSSINHSILSGMAESDGGVTLFQQLAHAQMLMAMSTLLFSIFEGHG